MAEAPGGPAPAACLDSGTHGHGGELESNPVLLLFRHFFQTRLLRLFAPGCHVLELGCGTGEDALLLAGKGVHVHVLEASSTGLERARAKATERGLAQVVRFEQQQAEELTELGSARYDGAYASSGALLGADLAAIGRGLSSVLRPDASVLLSIVGPRPLPAMLERGLTGQGTPRRTPWADGAAGPSRFPSPRQVRRSLGAAFRWQRDCALGVLVPGPAQAAWAHRHPQAFGLLAALEALLRAWPLLRGLGEQVVLQGVRAAEAQRK